ncbi:tripartite tricarboxylate transporter substrate-binding protein [Hydrogenophaga sp. RWCD_12]|uniref:tripartite tricarboxylate transporter substrate-binding protein n=1 Tax=Hydrogenophaga sp. RWCD_12 TaxID=3391190 RepID=UPI003984C7F9
MKKILAFAVTAAVYAGAFAQAYPSKPITLVVPFAAGGPTDLVARQLAEAMRKPLGGANIVVDNAAGAGGTIGAAKVARAAPDGYTLLVWHIGMAATTSLYRKQTFKPLDDFEYLGIINDVPMTIVGSNKLAQNRRYRDFENYVRTNSDKVNLAHAGLGSASHLCSLMWQSAMKLPKPLTTIAYKGTGPAMNDLIGGQVDMMCDQTTNTASQIESGRVRGYAVTTAKPLTGNKQLGDLPTLDGLGLKGFNLTIWHGLYAPKGTPADVLKKVNDALMVALKDPEFIKRQGDLGAVVAPAGDKRVTPAGHKAFVASEITKLKAAIDAAGEFAD